MSVNVKFIQIEGDASDVATVLGTALGTTTIIEPVAPTTDLPTPPPAPTPRDEVVIEADDVDEPSADIVPMRRRANAEPHADGEPVPGPFDEWDEIPAEWRWLSDAGDCMHVRQQPGLNIAMCKRGVKQIGARRLHDSTPPAPSMVSVCGQCNKSIRIAHRKAASA